MARDKAYYEAEKKIQQAQGPGFGGLVRLMNKRQEFLWVHEKFASEY